MSAFIKGTLVSDTGVMQTTSVGDGQAVPAGAVLIDGIAHAQTGERYVTTWPTSGVVAYHEGRAVRHDGVMVTAESVTPAVFLNGIGMTARGETLVATTGTPRYLAGFGITDAGALLVSNPGFSPLSLFTSGAAGVWYDPSDYTTLFQDSAGTTPVTAVEQPVGLMLDKSQGLVLGSELVTNGDFSGGTTGWTAVSGTGLAVVSGQLEIDTNANSVSGAYQSFATVSGKSYKATATIKVGTATDARLRAVNGLTNTGTLLADSSAITSTSNTEISVVFIAISTTSAVYLRVNGLDTTAYFDNISVKELPGNHATQATAASRPVLRARYNLLTYSEQFDNAAWTKANATVTANTGIAPDGTLTADTLVDDGTSGRHSLNQNPTLVASAPYTLSLYVKAGTGRYVTLSVSRVAAGSTYYAARYDLQTSTVTATAVSGSTTHISSSIMDVGSSWYRCDLTGILSTFTDAVVMVSGAINPTGFGDRGAEVYVGSGFTWLLWGADLRTGSSAGTYQRIAAATDYATAGFLPYLALDGTDDWLASGSINFSATDKMSVCFGVTKLSDALVGMVTELSADYGTNAGSFYFAAPETTGASGDFSINARGSTSGTRVSSIANAPVTRVATGLIDIAAPSKTLRLNGSQVDANSSSMGTGNFGNYPLYIGRRGGASLPFNGRIYQMVVCGKALSASELAALESFTNARTGAY